MKFISAVAALAATSHALEAHLEAEMTASDFYNIEAEKQAFDTAIDELEGIWTEATETLTMFYEIPVHYEMFVGVWRSEGFFGGEEFEIHADSTWNLSSEPTGTHSGLDTETQWSGDGLLCLVAGRSSRFFPR